MMIRWLLFVLLFVVFFFQQANLFSSSWSPVGLRIAILWFVELQAVFQKKGLPWKILFKRLRLCSSDPSILRIILVEMKVCKTFFRFLPLFVFCFNLSQCFYWCCIIFWVFVDRKACLFFYFCHPFNKEKKAWITNITYKNYSFWDRKNKYFSPLLKLIF